MDELINFNIKSVQQRFKKINNYVKYFEHNMTNFIFKICFTIRENDCLLNYTFL